MKKSFMKKWVKALRSGEYSQGTGCLVDQNDNFCCLGVACDLADTVGEWQKSPCEDWVFECSEDEQDIASLTKSMREFTGIKTEYGFIPSLGTDLASLNDRGKSFAEIAVIIEKHYEEI